MDPREHPLEIWGGVECTVNRVGDQFHDQLERSAHLSRLSDLDRFAELGLRAMRVLLPWERAQSEPDGPVNLEQAAPMLERVRSLGMTAICGLVHHGSGPRFTGLLEPSFEHGLSAYARCVAQRFPWLELYTPVNEPLTTARFSGLYGHWYPHHTRTRSFMRMLVHQCRATVRAMQAIRTVRSDARLLQTEDIGAIFASPSLRYQADYENQRRFLSFDLLCGRVDAQHPLYRHLLSEGIEESELGFFLDHPCPPDLMGVNYYVTSDRYLDERTERYPREQHGGNGRHEYVDVEAVRVGGVGLVGHEQVLRTVWERYHRPIVLSEVHLGCTREEQLRWLGEAHQAALLVRRDGIDVRALTVWALLGAFDWNSLVVQARGRYESGVFDLRSRVPRPTALSAMVACLAQQGTFEHPVLSGPGWWRRAPNVGSVRSVRARPLLLTGAGFELGQAFADACRERGLELVMLEQQQLDVADPDQLASAIAQHAPWAVIDAAGTRRSHTSPCADQGGRDDLRGSVALSQVCREKALRFVTFSNDLVFDGRGSQPYLEGDAVAPACGLGRAKAEAERRVLAAMPEALVVRSGVLLAGALTPAAWQKLMHTAGAGWHGATVSPSYGPHLVHACLDLLLDGAAGIWHLANAGAIAWTDLLEQMSRQTGFAPARVGAPDLNDSQLYRVLGSERAAIMPSLDEALDLWLHPPRQAA